MRLQMISAGYEIVPFEERADVYIINTCSVTNIADRKSRQMIHRARSKNPEAIVVAAGCYVQASAKDLLDEGCADILIGNNQKKAVPALIEEYLSTKSPVMRVEDLGRCREYENLELTDRVDHARAFIKIQDGCDQFCSYCIIPFTRGRVRSRKPEDILAETRTLAAQGYREIVLTGIHISSYGLDFPKEETTQQSDTQQPVVPSLEADTKEAVTQPGQQKSVWPERPLLDLLGELQKVDGIERIRLGSLEPRIITPQFVKEIAAMPKVCPHFHLSLQSGCNATLARMNRRYTAEEFAESLALLREAYEHPAITTDVITGFAGETEEEFAESREFLEKIGIYEIHVFPYSVRKGTRAEKMPHQNPESVRKERCRELLALTERQSHAFREWYLGRTTQILTEEQVEIDDRIYTVGFTKEYVKLAIEGGKWELGTILPVKVTGFLTPDKMLAEPLKIE